MAVKTQRAIIGGPSNSVYVCATAPLPDGQLQNDEIAVAVKAVALNPVDSKMVGPFVTEGATLGFDAAGEITAVGATVSKQGNLKVGDRVVVAINGMNSNRPKIGGFAEHTISYSWGALKIPDDWSYAQGAGGMGGSAWLTVPWALFHTMGLPAGPEFEPLNTHRPPPTGLAPKLNILTKHNPGDGSRPLTAVLVNGGGSYTGTCAIQLLKLAGYRVLATCSPRSFDLAKSFGADAVFDYSSDTCADDIRAYTNNSLRLVLDCISSVDTMRLCYAAMGRAGGRYVALDPYSEDIATSKPLIRNNWVVGMEPLGDEVGWPAPYGRPANPVALDFCKAWNPTMQGLLDRGLVRIHPQIVRDTGLDGVLEGLEDIRTKKVVGQKLIYTL